jgi:hypothetical protein
MGKYVLAALVAAVALVFGVGSAVADPSGGCVTSSGVTTCTFDSGPSESWTVPAGVSSVTIDARGGAGGSIVCTLSNCNHPGGAGGEVAAAIDVTPGDVFQVTVGGAGTGINPDTFPVSHLGGPGGANGGGSGGHGDPRAPGAGGGGGSDIRIGSCTATASCPLSARVIVAGGGGGAGGISPGAGGTLLAGESGAAAGTGPPFGGGGGGATSGGAGGRGMNVGDTIVGAGEAGQLGVGGTGGSVEGGSGGGGGGLYGGGGGGAFGAGGGGSSYLDPALGTALAPTGGGSGAGLVTISYELDTTSPAVTVNQAVGQADPTNTSPINFTVAFSERVAGFAAADVEVFGTAGATATTVEVSGGPKVFNVAVSGFAADGAVTAWVPASAATDVVGNTSTESTSTDNTVSVDTTAPVTTLTLDPASPNGASSWYKTSTPTFTLSAPGDATTYYKIGDGSTLTYAGKAVSIPDGEHTISYWSVDTAGNTETTHTTSTIKVDTGAPTIACSVASPGPTFALGAIGQVVTGTLSDTGSGPASQSLSAAANTSSAGAKTVSLNGSDTAGNAAAATSCPYVVGYAFGGFTSPLPKSTVKSGSSLPVKFQLQDASGQPISDTEAQSLVSPTCKIAIILVKPAGAVSGCPTYNTTLKAFQFNLKTTDAMKGANGVSISVTIGDTVVTTAAVLAFTVK